MVDSVRRAQLEQGLHWVESEIRRHAETVGRSADDVTLVVVTKTWPVDDIRALSDLGVRDIGESRHPEAGQKADELADLPLRWHFVGQLQTNKAAKVTAYADLVHSVDSVRLAQRLDVGASNHDRVLDCLVQVNLDAELPRDQPGRAPRGGVSPRHVAELACAIAYAGNLRLRGLMGVAPRVGETRQAFDRLAALAASLQSDHPSAQVVSAGMSGDFGTAIEAGATHVRVGSAILGQRAPLG